MNTGPAILAVLSVVVMTFVGNVEAECSNDKIERIKKHWGSNVPRNVYKETVTLTYVYTTSNLLTKDDSQQQCLITKVAPGASGPSVQIINVPRDFQEHRPEVIYNYNLVEKDGEIILKDEEGEVVMRQFVLSTGEHSVVFWQCFEDEGAPPVAAVAVDVNHLQNTEEEVSKAEKILQNLKLDMGEEVGYCTPEILK